MFGSGHGRKDLLTVATIGCAALLLACTSAFAQSSLKSRRELVVGDHPVGVIAADFDEDGNLDLLSIDQISSTLTLDKGFGDGSFRKLTTIIAGVLPSGGTYVDVNGDGKPDIVVSNHRSLDVTVNLNDGTGNFLPKISNPVSGNAAGLAVGDWNGDGKIDVATVNTVQNKVSVLLGDGTGHFGSLRQFTTGTTPKQIVAADFNKDGKLDLAVVNNLSNSIQIFRGDGAGNFTLLSTVATGTGPISMAAADFNADTNLDIAVSNNVGETVGVYLGTGTGTFGTPRLLSPGFGPYGIIAVDITKDGKLDLLITMFEISGVGELAQMVGDGTGNFGPPTVYSTGPSPRTAAVGDFNKDGNLDVVTANNTGNTLSILQNVGAGAFLTAGRVNVPAGSFPAALAVDHFNADSILDIVIANEATNTVSVANGDCLGGFGAVNSANNTGITPLAIAVTDLNGDGDADLVTANYGDDTLSILQNSGTGNFTVTNGLPVGTLGTCSSVTALSVGEISGDNHPDVAFVCEGGGWYCTRQGTGAGGASAFGAPVCTQIGGALEGIALGNYNLDALEDAAITSRDLNQIDIAFSNGNGGVVDIPGTFPVGALPTGIARNNLHGHNFNCNLPGNGFCDLVVADGGSASVSALLGDGGGVFSFPSIDSVAGQAPEDLVLADFNLDGWLDVATVNTNSNSVTLLLGDGTGRFTNAGDYGVRDQPLAIAAGDFNCDGRPDLAVADNFSDSVTILLNQIVVGDPLQFTSITGTGKVVFRWGIVPGAVYDVIRGRVKSVSQGASSFNLGAVTCLGDNLTVTDTADTPDGSNPPLGDAYFYAVRSVVGGVPGQYTVATNGKPGVPASGGCP